MLLNNNLYYIKSLRHEPGSVNASLELNADHQIFKGHFPGQPVLPGVCMLQIIKEVLESALNEDLRLNAADHLKFLSMVVPDKTPLLQLTAGYTDNTENLAVTASLNTGEAVCLKFKGVFDKKPD